MSRDPETSVFQCLPECLYYQCMSGDTRTITEYRVFKVQTKTNQNLTFDIILFNNI